MFYNQSLPTRKNGCNNILTFKLPPDEVLSATNLNSSLRINFPYKGYFSLCKGQIEMPLGIHVGIKGKPLGQMSQRFPISISEYSRKSCIMFFLCKTSVRLSIVVVPQKLLADFLRTARVGQVYLLNTLSCQRLLKLSTVAFLPGSPWGIKTT